MGNKPNIIDLFCGCGENVLSDIVDLDTLWLLYTKINLHPKNISNHRIYSCVIMKYIRYLNKGNRIGKRVDYGKAKTKE